MRDRKAPMAFTLLLLIVFFILSLPSSKPREGARGTWLLNPQSDLENKELIQVLRRASMEDKTVIMTIIDERWASPGSVLDLFLESFRIGQGTKRLLNHLVIVTLDKQAFQYCKSLHPHCFQLESLPSKQATRKRLEVQDFIFDSKINNLLQQVLKLGYHFILTEVDVMWLRTPIPDMHAMYEITIACDDYTKESQSKTHKQNSGLFHSKSNGLSIELLRYWRIMGILYPYFHAESVCDVLTHEKEYIEMLGLRINYLETSSFAEFCQPDCENIREVYTMHANCCDRVENKVYDLRLVLDDWKTFIERTSNVSLGPVPSWRAPAKCVA